MIACTVPCAEAGLLAQAVEPAAAPQAAQSGPGTYRLRVNAQAVVLDVVVTDSKGTPVTNLTRDDFEIFEDKTPQAIRSFEPPATHSPVTVPIHSTEELDRLAPNAPVSLIVLDEINTTFEDEAFTRYSLKKYLDTMGDTLAEPTMLVAVTTGHFALLQDYTTSKRDLLAALDHHITGYPWQEQSASWKQEQFNAAVASLMEVAQATAGHPGHKTLIWVGRGFPNFDMTALQPEAAYGIKTVIETCTNALRDARVVLYTLDPGGIPTADAPTDENGFFTGDPFGINVDFNTMAKETGGEAFYGRNDVDHLIAASARDAGSFYTMSYSPKHQEADPKAFHAIRVTVRVPGLHVATRQGYYTAVANDAPVPAVAPDGKTSTRERFDLSVAGESTMVYDAVPFTVTRVSPGGDDFRISIRSSAVPWQPSGPDKLRGTLTVLVKSYDGRGKLLSQHGEDQTVEVPRAADSDEPAAQNFVLSATAQTEAPATRLRFVVRVNGTGKLGASNVFLNGKTEPAETTRQ